jgi:serine/threonine-protein kinase
MGEVWLAERRSAGGNVQPVAVKFISEAGWIGALASEARRISQLSHDNIVPFVDSGHDSDGRFFLAMAYIEGVDLDGLRALMDFQTEAAYSGKAGIRLPDPIVGIILLMVLRALRHAHNFKFEDGVVGLIHRDVSPGNILIDRACGFVKLTDFGVAGFQGDESTQGNRITGKVPYMAPEMLAGEPSDKRADLYSLGIVAYEALTGFNPNIMPAQMDNVLGAITNIMLALERPLRLPHEVVEGVDPRLSNIVTRLLENDPDERYLSAEAVIVDISDFLRDKGVAPNAAILARYLEILRNPEVENSEPQQWARQFPEGKDFRLEIRPRWVITAKAAQDLAKGGNPAREL